MTEESILFSPRRNNAAGRKVTPKEVAAEARKIMSGSFAGSFPRTFRCLQDMALAGANAYKNNGKRAFFGLGRDLTIETIIKFNYSVATLVLAMKSEELFDLPATNGMTEISIVEHTVGLFFLAYPNWKDAEATWNTVGKNTASTALSRLR